TTQAGNNLVRANGVSLHYPAGWAMNQQVLQLGGPIALRNFSAYLRGGIIPGGGAEIEITHVPQSTQPLDAIVKSELGIEGTPQAVDGQAAVRAFYVDDFAPGLSYESIAVYSFHDNLLYKFFLSYRAGDPQKQNFINNFDEVIASTHFQ